MTADHLERHQRCDLLSQAASDHITDDLALTPVRNLLDHDGRCADHPDGDDEVVGLKLFEVDHVDRPVLADRVPGHQPSDSRVTPAATGKDRAPDR